VIFTATSTEDFTLHKTDWKVINNTSAKNVDWHSTKLKQIIALETENISYIFSTSKYTGCECSCDPVAMTANDSLFTLYKRTQYVIYRQRRQSKFIIRGGGAKFYRNIHSLTCVPEVRRAKNRSWRPTAVLGMLGRRQRASMHQLWGLGNAVISPSGVCSRAPAANASFLGIEKPRNRLKLWGGEKILSPLYFYWRGAIAPRFHCIKTHDGSCLGDVLG